MATFVAGQAQEVEEARRAGRREAAPICRDAPLGRLLHDERLCWRRPTGPSLQKMSKPEGPKGRHWVGPLVTRIMVGKLRSDRLPKAEGGTQEAEETMNKTQRF